MNSLYRASVYQSILKLKIRQPGFPSYIIQAILTPSCLWNSIAGLLKSPQTNTSTTLVKIPHDKSEISFPKTTAHASNRNANVIPAIEHRLFLVSQHHNLQFSTFYNNNNNMNTWLAASGTTGLRDAEARGTTDAESTIKVFIAETPWSSLTNSRQI